LINILQAKRISLGKFNYGPRPSEFSVENLEEKCHYIEEEGFVYYGEV